MCPQVHQAGPEDLLGPLDQGLYVDWEDWEDLDLLQVAAVVALLQIKLHHLSVNILWLPWLAFDYQRREQMIHSPKYFAGTVFRHYHVGMKPLL